MKKFVASFMLMVVLFSMTEFHELVKVPFAFGHFIEHYSENQTLSVGKFLADHYSHTESHSHDHSSLPFKEHSLTTVIQSLESSVSISTLIVLPFSKIHYFHISDFDISLGTNLDIWQPP